MDWLARLEEAEEKKRQRNTCVLAHVSTTCIGEDVATPTHEKNQNTLEVRTDKRGQKGQESELDQRRAEQASTLGLVAKYSYEFGWVSIHDPTTGEWHDLPFKEAPGWAKREAKKRKELYKGGNRRAYQLTATEMEEVYEAEQVEMWAEPYRPDDAREGLVYDEDREEEE